MAHRCFLHIFCTALCLMTLHCHHGAGDPADGPVMMGDMADPMDLAQAVGDAGDRDLHVTDDAAMTDGAASPDSGDDAAVGDAAPATDGPAMDAAMTDGPPRDSGATVDSGIDGGGGSCTGMGFGAATDFTLPTGFNKGGFASFEGGLSCDSFNSINQPRYVVQDIDGDGRPDLILTQACNPMTYVRDPTVGVSRWIVYKNTGTGFMGPADFTLPTGFNKGGFASFESGLSCDSFNSINQPRYAVRDLDGDNKPDLILTQACNPMTYVRDPTVGVSRWIVYKNTGTGFMGPTDFALPTGFNKGGFASFESGLSCDSFNSINQPRYAVRDLDGDNKPDLILTQACNPMTYVRDPTVGVSRWIVYKNTGTEFMGPADFTLPTGFNKGGFASFESGLSCDSFNAINQPRYVVQDIDGDNRPDLILTQACNPMTYVRDPTVGTEKWIVHANLTTGFTAAGAPFCLPTGFNKGGFATFEGGLSCDSFNSINQPRFSVRQLVGSTRLDLVLTQACNPATYTRDPTVGVSRWIVY